MYNINLSIYHNLQDKDLINCLMAVKPLERFQHEFYEYSDSRGLSAADIIICKTDDVSFIEKISKVRKNESHLLVIINSEDRSNFIPVLTGYDDYMTNPVYTNTLCFRFEKMLSRIKEEKDGWLSGYYLDSLINSVPDLVWFKDKKGAHLKVNNSFCHAVNKTHEQIQGRGHYYIWDIDPEDYAKGEYICMESEFEVMEKKKTCVFNENVMIAEDMRELRTYKSPLFDYDGSVMGTCGFARDVTTENKYKKKMLENANHDFLTGLYNRRYIYNYIENLKGTEFSLYYVDLDNFKKVNDMYGHTEGDRALVLATEVLQNAMPDATISRVGGDEFLAVKTGHASKEDIEKNADMLDGAFKSAFSKIPSFTVLSASVGTFHVNEKTNIPTDSIINEADERMYQKKEERHNSAERRHEIKIDPVTGLDRYEVFIDKLTKELEYIGDRRIAIVYGDIKHFKYINDTFSYQKGNEVLKFFASKIVDFKDNFICATRLYSDNVVAAAYVDEKYSEDTYCTRVREWGKGFEKELSNRLLTNKLKFVAGINFITKDNITDAETAVSNANLAKKDAKKSKDGCVLAFNINMLNIINWEMEISASLPDAIANHDLTAFYQPKIDTNTLKIIGGEALVRWKQKDGSYLAPDQFIPILEKTGQIYDVDYYVYREVFSFIHKQLTNGKRIVPISMNVSRVHLLQHDFISYVKSLFDEFPIPAKYVEFELTESIYIRNSEEAKKLVNSLHEMGITVSMDDFGTGYSSLNMLGSIPIDTIKLDKAFLQGDELSNNDKIIISSVIDMSKKLNMKSICEGVENEKQIEYLKDAGCDEQQGYYFSKPIPREAFEQMIDE